MRYCARCILPDTRPNIRLTDQRVCNACISHQSKTGIDWAERQKAFGNVVQLAKTKAVGYDCLIPVSGGKDSTWQVIKCLEYGLKPLAVTWKTPARTSIGARNLENLVNLGVDHVDYRISPKVEQKFMYLALERFGDPAIPMHLALFNIPLTIAIRFGIPLVVWGENSAFEYGNLEERHSGFRLDGGWLKTYGVTQGTTAFDWISDGLSQKDLVPYTGPSEEELEQKEVLAVFLGYYFPWDPAVTYAAARAHGFRARPAGPKTGFYDYADIDDDFISVHHFIKWHKFGFTRLFDNLSLEIRNGRISREKAIEIVRETGLQVPIGDIRKLCRFLEMPPRRFWEIVERFRNLDIWKNDNGVWKIDDFLIPDWRWE